MPGGTKGGNKFDLTQYNPKYFGRLKAFVASASKHGVVVSLGVIRRQSPTASQRRV